MIGYIYLTVNTINGVAYVGKRQKPKFEKCYKGSGTHLKLAFQKYGRDNFRTTVLEWCESEEDLCEAEKRWIAFYKGSGVELYNIQDGGKGGNVINWCKLPKEKRDEINRKNSVAHMGPKNGFWGKHHTEETKAVIREKGSKNWRYPLELIAYKDRQRDSLPAIAQFDKTTGKLIAVWNNWCDAGKAVCPTSRCAHSHIRQCCRHERKSAYGFRWELAESGWTI